MPLTITRLEASRGHSEVLPDLGAPPGQTQRLSCHCPDSRVLGRKTVFSPLLSIWPHPTPSRLQVPLTLLPRSRLGSSGASSPISRGFKNLPTKSRSRWKARKASWEAEKQVVKLSPRPLPASLTPGKMMLSSSPNLCSDNKRDFPPPRGKCSLQTQPQDTFPLQGSNGKQYPP